jgi:hypothetical protein
LPDCADVCAEWQHNNLDPDLQVHILTAIYGSKITPNSLRRVLSNLKTEHKGANSIGQLRRRLKEYITDLRRGKKSSDPRNKTVLTAQNMMNNWKPSDSFGPNLYRNQ